MKLELGGGAEEDGPERDVTCGMSLPGVKTVDGKALRIHNNSF